MLVSTSALFLCLYSVHRPPFLLSRFGRWGHTSQLCLSSPPPFRSIEAHLFCILSLLSLTLLYNHITVSTFPHAAHKSRSPTRRRGVFGVLGWHARIFGFPTLTSIYEYRRGEDVVNVSPPSQSTAKGVGQIRAGLVAMKVGHDQLGAVDVHVATGPVHTAQP